MWRLLIATLGLKITDRDLPMQLSINSSVLTRGFYKDEKYLIKNDKIHPFIWKIYVALKTDLSKPLKGH